MASAARRGFPEVTGGTSVSCARGTLADPSRSLACAVRKRCAVPHRQGVRAACGISRGTRLRHGYALPRFSVEVTYPDSGGRRFVRAGADRGNLGCHLGLGKVLQTRRLRWWTTRWYAVRSAVVGLFPPQCGQLATLTLANSKRSQDRVELPAPVQIFEVCGVVRVKARAQAGRLVFCGVSVLTFDSKSRRATSGLDKTPGCGWEKWQGLAGGA